MYYLSENVYNINMGEFPSGQRGQTVNLLALPSVVRIHLRPLNTLDKIIKSIYTNNVSAGWSSLEARRAHNPKVVGSKPAPAIFYA